MFNKDKNAGTSGTSNTPSWGEIELEQEAIKRVINQHGPRAHRSPNYLELVEDAKRQIQQAIEANKTF